jgi:hypothetical protein
VPALGGNNLLEVPDPPTYHVEAVYIGPTWKRGADGRFVLPEWTLGWQILRWIDEYLGATKKWVPTKEQARFLLWWYAIDERGRFVYRDGVLQRLKGWGKDPIVAVISLVEMLGPCRFSHFTAVDMPEWNLAAGDPVGEEHEDAWIQVAATALEQTKNTMKLFPSLISRKLMQAHGMNKLDIGKTVIYAHGGRRTIEAVTSSPSTLEGARATFVIRNETHHWNGSNSGFEMAEVIERNATKSAGGQSRALSITNAYDPSEGSVAQSQRESWEAEASGESVETGVLYDSIEAPEGISMRPPEAKDWKPTEDPATLAYREACVKAWLSTVVTAVRGDAVWLDLESIVMAILRRRERNGKVVSLSLARRFWFNVIVAAEDSWADPAAVEAAIDPLLRTARAQERDSDQLRMGWIVDPTDPIVMFFDGSKSDDSTVLVGCRLSDGFTFTLGVWSKPAGKAGEGWLAPREQADQRVEEVFKRFNVVAFWADPSHALDDDNTRYWDGYIDKWHRKHQDKLQAWPVQTGTQVHSIMWDMAAKVRSEQFAAAAELVRTELHHRDHEGRFAPKFTHDGHPALRAHMKNAKEHRIQTTGEKTLVSLAKNNRESHKKIDLAVGLVGAQMLRRVVLNQGVKEEEETGGWVTSL